ncbi:hypothetical protein BT67DRAFT_441675 [Trichocladium antarcticum]|uniref:Protein bir1 n=1 Tax=Trichocladium antarcticum TaxID=1450529 RepID=A0AAN6ZE43_9PEZI|nr:hypothetical protein BT67DRAFT_441675 [Trichocladium antarcticum]
MAMAVSDEQYFVFENRLASFRGPRAVSGSGANARTSKTLQWPHKSLSPTALAHAGFFFEPHPKSPDNVVCFLCNKSLDGWEEGDSPLEEHLRHSPTCGWAINAAIEAGHGNYGKIHPLDPAMTEARKATFAGRWPYESKRGFKCKTKKLVEAGWKYTPSLDADDMATCAYCQLALEGWESDDNPFEEHSRREPGCPFFVLISQYPAPKKGRARAARSSKASRLSVQSVATVATSASDLASAADITADHDDSVMTTASTMTQGGKRATKAGKATTAKGRKTKAKKNEPIEILEDEPQTLEDPPPKKPARGRKRASDAMEDSAVTNAEAPAPKRRATRVRASNAVDNSNPAAPIPDTEIADAVPAKQPAAKKRARASTTKTTRKVSRTSVRSQASTASLHGNLDDDEIDRQLEAELERYHSEADDLVEEKASAPAKGRPKKTAAARKTSTKRETGLSESYAMFNPAPMVPDEAEVEADFQALQAEMILEQPTATDSLVIPKKGRKTGTRKASKQTKKAKEPAPQPLPVEEAVEDVAAPVSGPMQYPETDETQQEPEMELIDDPDVSTGTVITKTVRRPSLEKRERGRPSRNSTASQAAAQEPEPRRSSVISVKVQTQTETPRTRGSIAARKSTPGKVLRKPAPVASQLPPALAQASVEAVPTAPTPKSEKAAPSLPPSSTNRGAPQPTTPRSAAPRITPSRFAAQAALFSPSQSPGSSDAENQPPSSTPPPPPPPPPPPSTNTLSKTVVLAHPTPLPPVSTPPMRSTSPSKRNVIAGLHSTVPWRPADMDRILSFSPATPHGDGDEDAAARQLVLHQQSRGGGGERGELASPERRMTVEQWIYHNAELAEAQLKRECEAMVSAFEREGSRAMRALEGLVVE